VLCWASGSGNRDEKTMMKKLLALCLAWTLMGLAQATGRAIEIDVVVDAPLEKVWEAWTTPAGIISFFAPAAEVEARPGGPFHIFINPLAPIGQKGADYMRFMAIQPMKLLSFDWNAPPNLPQARAQRTFVMLHFEPVGPGQTRVRLTHVGWGEGGEWDQAYTYFERAWGNVLANLQKRFVSGPIDWTDWMNQLRKLQEQQDRK
jgi:uncharacterized protein YndB with AHSA1/START domain